MIPNSDGLSLVGETQYAIQWAFKQPLSPCFASAVVAASQLRAYLVNHCTESQLVLPSASSHHF